MKTKIRRKLLLAGGLFLCFVLFTVLVAGFDVKPIGPEGSEVGFATINGLIFQKLGIHSVWYGVTEWLGIAAFLFPVGFGGVGLYQLVKRRSIWKVDRELLVLGLFYLLVVVCYLFFEGIVINYRPVILEEGLEASYPSSHTMLVVCIMASASMRFHALYPERKKLCQGMDVLAILLSGVTVIGRLLSGVHWFTDIVGGLLLSVSLAAMYGAVLDWITE